MCQSASLRVLVLIFFGLNSLILYLRKFYFYLSRGSVTDACSYQESQDKAHGSKLCDEAAYFLSFYDLIGIQILSLMIFYSCYMLTLIRSAFFSTSVKNHTL